MENEKELFNEKYNRKIEKIFLIIIICVLFFVICLWEYND